VQNYQSIPYLWPAMDGGQGGLAVGGAGDWSGLGFVQGGEKGEETEGVLGSCSPRAERGGKMAGGGPQRWPAVELSGGGAPVEFRQLEVAERVRLGAAMLVAASTSPADPPSRRIGAAAGAGSKPRRRHCTKRPAVRRRGLRTRAVAVC
jgi:hypothetical protein